ncbi:MAG: formylglycine-generating enzyme family protein [Planctomycetota bacterium]|nr:formylglycine-generating enzyme family protein [Planctomycetota bacterium]
MLKQIPWFICIGLSVVCSEPAEESKLPESLAADFEIPSESKDAYGNAVRLGFDKESGLPHEIRHKVTGMHLVFIPAGEFMMGSPKNEKDRAKDETQHRVTVTKPFYMGKYEVTQAEWKQVTGKEPWKGQTYAKENSRHAATEISWQDCQEFLGKAGSELRLPTEAEWEYACRAGTTTAYSFGDGSSKLGDYGWFSENASAKGERSENASAKGERYAHPVGQKKPNAWGLYDMHGNVWEWCSDWFGDYSSRTDTDPTGAQSGSYRVHRGGSWCSDARSCRSAIRGRLIPGYWFNNVGLGFRLVVPSVQLR